jgi:hypothetical protein
MTGYPAKAQIIAKFLEKTRFFEPVSNCFPLHSKIGKSRSAIRRGGFG